MAMRAPRISVSGALGAICASDWRLVRAPLMSPAASWDSGVLDPHGKPRPAYDVVARWVKHEAAERRNPVLVVRDL